MAFCAIFIIYLYVYKYATVDDFIFRNLENAMLIENNGFMDSSIDPFPGFTLLCVFFSNILGIEYETVVSLPFLAPLFIFTLIVLVKKLLPSPLVIPSILIIGTWMLFFGVNPTLFPHTIGLALCLVVIFISLRRLSQLNDENNSDAILSGLSILFIIALNIVSYKFMFFTIFFLLLFQIFFFMEKHNRGKNDNTKNKQFTNIIIIGLILATTFNWFFYKAFIPAIQNSADHPLEGISGLVSIFYSSNQITPLSQYYFVGNINNAPLYVLWYLIVGIIVIICIIIILLKILKRKPLSIGEKCIASIIVSGSVLFILYNSLGHIELTLVLIAGILGFEILYSKKRIHINKFITLSLSILLLLTVTMNILAITNNSYGGQTDGYEFVYLKSPSGWYNSHYNEGTHTTLTDQFTGGYFSKEASSLGNSYYSKPFSEEDVLYLIEERPYSSDSENNYYILNCKEISIVIQGWVRINAWSNFNDNINCNENIIKIYTSKNIVICN